MEATSIRAPICATMFTTKDDAAIKAAWAIYNEARSIYDTAPDEGPYIEGVNAAQREQIDIMAPAETTIGEAVPTSLRGIEIQLWAMLVHSADTQEAATLARTEQLDACADQFDWIGDHALNAIRGIRQMQERPTQDAFAVKLARYQEAVTRRAEYEAAHTPAIVAGLTPEWEAFESAMYPLHVSVFEAGRAALLEPAPDLAALVAKRAVFDALEFWAMGDEPTVSARLFDDAVALAGGAA